MGFRRWRQSMAVMVAIAALTGPQAAAAAGLPPILGFSLPNLASLIPPGPTFVAGYDVGGSAGGLSFAGTATGALRGAWTAQVEVSGAPQVGPAPASLQVQKGVLTLVALGAPFSIAIGPATATLAGASATTGGASGGAATTVAAATGPIVPTSVATAEEMLQVWSATYRAAAGSAATQAALAAQAGAVEHAFPALAALGAFPWPAAALATLPRVLTPPGADGCGDTAYPVTLRLSLASIANGTFTGQVIFYRTDTAAACVTYGASISGQIVVASAAG